ncbi:helix-turn-helix domain-containing protein [Niallia sp. Krafla_26]|uniref:helix-turn-helix domain-containing protein n=1 Tax=Niallia sp. Krafla_26 TaxID=3064703 RepID=UPI003D184460
MLVLYCLQKLKGERTIFSIFHLLHGKQSSQTIQDAYLFHLTAFFNTFPALSRNDLEKIITLFTANGWVQMISDDSYILTEEGNKFLIEKVNEMPIPKHLDGMNIQKQSILFWERLTLLVQVVSYLQKHDSRYIPIQKSPETIFSIKTFLKQNTLDRDTLSVSLYNEFISCLDEEPSINPDLLVVRLSGYHSVGLTVEQAAQTFRLEVTHYYYEFINILHYMVNRIEHDRERYPILSCLIEPSQSINLTQSTEKTLDLLSKGYSVSAIMEIRHLKKGTIEDHIVELALKNKNFSIDPFVTQEKQNQIIQVANGLNTKQLKMIRNRIEGATYFEIRLVLAKYGDQLC